MTESGSLFRKQAITILKNKDWAVDEKYECGYRLAKKTPYKLIKAQKGGFEFLISCKYQDVPGSASHKLPYEYMCLMHAIKTNMMDFGCLVLFGKESSGDIFSKAGVKELSSYMQFKKYCAIYTFEDFTKLVIRDEIQQDIMR